MKTIEEKIYECLGIKHFKRMVVLLGKRVRRNQKISKGDNYFLYALTTDGIKNFKENGIKVNTIVHLGALPFCVLNIITASSTTGVILFSLGGLINLYCAMLQRYNNIRLNRIYKQMEKRETRKDEKNSETKKKPSQTIELKPSINNNAEIEYLKDLKTNLLDHQPLNSTLNEEKADYKVKIK
ncbi:MAG: hypothetical protein PHD10_02740 [Bacilli bacterium]|nr:hypothetical protein [Bacilli bacterium]MDD4608029.1 hypothetical protein [Bacilli bacterium]